MRVNDPTEKVLIRETVYENYIFTGIYASFIFGVALFFVAWKIAVKFSNIPATIFVCTLGCGLIGLSIYLFNSKKKTFELVEMPNGKFKINLTSFGSSIQIDPVKRVGFFYQELSTLKSAQIRGVSIYAVFYNQNEEAVFGLSEADVAFLFYKSKPGFKEIKALEVASKGFLDAMYVYSGPVKKVYELTNDNG